METGFYNPGIYAFHTGISDANEARGVLPLLHELSIKGSMGWGHTGFIVDFESHDDLALFTLAFGAQQNFEPELDDIPGY